MPWLRTCESSHWETRILRRTALALPTRSLCLVSALLLSGPRTSLRLPAPACCVCACNTPLLRAPGLSLCHPTPARLGCGRMWHELRELAKAKPLVASMSDVAASGGYYMAMAAPTIVAEHLTLTGSIGVVLGENCCGETPVACRYFKRACPVRGLMAPSPGRHQRPGNHQAVPGGDFGGRTALQPGSRQWTSVGQSTPRGTVCGAHRVTWML